ncbi:MAG: hypothetical protein ACRDAM_20040 [Casimicrobium sp.]
MTPSEKDFHSADAQKSPSRELIELEASVLELVAGGSGTPVEKNRLWAV